MRALLYLEWRYAYHRAAAVVRSPLRLALWVPYLAFLGSTAYRRFVSQGHPVQLLPVNGAWKTVAGAAYLGLIALIVGVAANKRGWALRSDAEAILFSNAGIRPITIVVWLQLRKVARGWQGFFAGTIFAFLLFAPSRGSAAADVRPFAATLLAFALPTALEIPAFLVSIGRWGGVLRGFAFTVAALAAALAAGAAFSGAAAEPLLRRSHADPAAAVDAVLSGSTPALVALTTVIAALVAAVAALGGDALPELYAASRTPVPRRPARVMRARTRASQRARLGPVPGGALALVWKDWAGFRNSRLTVLWLWGGLVWAACGATAGVFAASSAHRAGPVTMLVLMATGFVLLVAPLGAAAGLGPELSKPLFWLSSAPLRMRLAAWTFGRAWRGGLFASLGPLAAGIASLNVPLALAALPLALATYCSLQALGVGLYALFPYPLDARGPVAVLRTFVELGFVLPPLVVAAVTFAFGGDAVAAAALTAVAFVVEGWITLELASMRLQERGAAFATAGRES